MSVQFALQFPIGIVLARLLLPENFGLAALCLVVTGFITLASDLGLGSALIQRRELNEKHIRVALTASLVLGLSICALLSLAAPLIGSVARSDELPELLRVQSLMFITVGYGTVLRAVIQRSLDFKKLFFVEVTSYIVGYALVAIVGAVSGLGVWSLVLGTVGQNIIACALSIKSAKAPLLPLLARQELGELLGFGVSVSANSLISYVARNGDNFLVGRLLGPTALGYYSRAFNLMMMPLNYITGTFFNVLVPALAEMQDERLRMGKAFIMSVQLTSIIVVPIAAVMFIAAPHLILGIYGDRWSEAIRPLQILCLASLPRAVPSLAGAVNRACNRTVSELWIQCAFAVAVLGGTVVGSHYGLVGVAWMVSLAIVLIFVASAGLALKLTGSTWAAFTIAHFPGIAIGLMTVTIALPIRVVLENSGWSHLPILAALMLAYAVSMPLGIYLLPMRVRPNDLFSRLAPMLSVLPIQVRTGIMLVLRSTQ